MNKSLPLFIHFFIFTYLFITSFLSFWVSHFSISAFSIYSCPRQILDDNICKGDICSRMLRKYSLFQLYPDY